jgi:hypothetical protein
MTRRRSAEHEVVESLHHRTHTRTVPSSVDPRPAALAAYLRERAADFSMSADVNMQQHVARAGMVLLDAALLAERLTPSDYRLRLLSESGRFETMAENTFAVVETAGMRAVLQRPLAGVPLTGEQVLTSLARASSEET